MLHSKLICKDDIDNIFNTLAYEYELLGGKKKTVATTVLFYS